jgi:hypothetical protein
MMNHKQMNEHDLPTVALFRQNIIPEVARRKHDFTKEGLCPQT